MGEFQYYETKKFTLFMERFTRLPHLIFAYIFISIITDSKKKINTLQIRLKNTPQYMIGCLQIYVLQHQCNNLKWET